MSRPMWGFITNFYAPKIINDCTNALKNIPDTLLLAPSLTRILDIWAQLFWAIFRFPTTTSQYLSKDVKIHPNNLKGVTISSGLP